MPVGQPTPKTILVLCTGNSARSILAEALIPYVTEGRWRAFSAGSKPTGTINPFALKVLQDAGVPIPPDARSKSWDEFSGPNAPKLDVVLTVCDNAAGETCPLFSGPARRLHMSFPDPAAFEGSDAAKRAAFQIIFDSMKPRLNMLLATL
ncbi:MAG: arsenate reductase ArsC [Hyphomicrobiaceae bacterium]|nr:arsenate reductase ArsC [Hyphomicrobiaceae bacterium]